MKNRKVKRLRLILTAGCFCLLLTSMATMGAVPALSQGEGPDALQATPTPPGEEGALVFGITLADLGYGERVLDSPYGEAEYIVRLPTDWKLGAGNSLRLDFSYTYERIGIPENQALPPLFGDLIVVVDGQVQPAFPIQEPMLDHASVRVSMPRPSSTDPDPNTYTVKVILDAVPVCSVPHRARLVVHSTSFFYFHYDQLPVTPDLALYPHHFYQRAFERDQVRFVLPAWPTQMELSGAAAVAAKLGDLTGRMSISGITDLELLDRLGAGEALSEHLIVIGRPETNGLILSLNQLGVLPVPLRERQLDLSTEGPAGVMPGDVFTYTLALVNTTQDTISSLSLIDTLPSYTRLVACSPRCTEGAQGSEVNWSVPSLAAGRALSYSLGLRVSKVVTGSVLENTVALLDASSAPLNVDTLTTTVGFTPLPSPELGSPASGESPYFFWQGERAVPENDGVVQELVSPWDPTRAILVITGLSDGAVHKACQAMSFESHFPGMQGPFALVREVHPMPDLPPASQATDLTFADLGYENRMLEGQTQQAVYYFKVPFSWRLTEAAYLKLRFSHTPFLDPGRSSLSVLLNDQPIAAIALSDETSLAGELSVELPPSEIRRGKRNVISIRIEMRPADECAPADMWLLVSNTSLLHLDHKELEGGPLALSFYPYPFDQQPGLADVLFVLPPEPRLEEWEELLQLATILGNAAGGSDLAPAVSLGGTGTDAVLSDYHLIVMGRPSRSPLLQQVNAQLPQPFQPGSDEIEQRIDEVVFRLPSGLSLGLVQLMTSPWNEARAFLALTGTTDEGFKWAVDALTDQPWALRGDLALVRDGEVTTIDTRMLTSSGTALAVSAVAPEMMAVVSSTVESAPGVSDAEQTSRGSGRPLWLIPLVGVTAIAVIAIFAIAFRQIWRRRS